MKQTLLAALFIMSIAGCASVSNPFDARPVMMHPWDRVSAGMTHAAVAIIMDGRAVVGHEPDAAGTFKPVEAQNLYSAEIVEIKGVLYQVDRYIVHSPAQGEHLNEAELYPVIYKDGLVVAKGKEGLVGLRSAK
jgi:hypothetical protein